MPRQQVERLTRVGVGVLTGGRWHCHLLLPLFCLVSATGLSARTQSAFYLAQLAPQSTTTPTENSSAWQLGSEHQKLSPKGRRKTTLFWQYGESGTLPVWLTINAECVSPTEKSATLLDRAAPKGELQAEDLRVGANTIRLCYAVDSGGAREAKSIEIVRDDTPPRLKALPESGRYAEIPEVRLESQDAPAAFYYILENSEIPTGLEGWLQKGKRYEAPIRASSDKLAIAAIAVSEAGVLSEVQVADYTKDLRLKGWNDVDFHFGYGQMQMLGTQKANFPSASSLLAGFRIGLDEYLQPGIANVHARAIWVPALWTDFQYASLSGTRYRETYVAGAIGPEWSLALLSSRSLLAVMGLSAGVAHVTVSDSATSNSALTFVAHGRAGLEYHLGSFGLFAHMRFTHLADQQYPLQSYGYNVGAIIKLW